VFSYSSHAFLCLLIFLKQGLGELDVVFDGNGKVVSCDGSIRIPYDKTKYEPADMLDEAFVSGFTEYLGNFSILVRTKT
jgi:hypothetical protein